MAATAIKAVEYRGIRGAVVAEVISDTTEGIEFGTPFALVPTSELTKERETSSEVHYYDNQPAVNVDADGPDTVNITGAAIPDDVLAKITGQFYDEELGLFIEGEREVKDYALGYITEDTSGEERFVWRMKGRFNIPSSTHNTKDNGTTANGQQLTYTGVPTLYKFKKRGKSERAVVIKASKCPLSEDAFFAEVQTPDTITAT